MKAGVVRKSALMAMAAVVVASLALPVFAADPITPAKARAISKLAYIYGFPMVESYRIQYAYFVDRGNPEFKAPWNQIKNVPRVFTPDDKAVQTPNSDTLYSVLGMDLRTEPLVLTVPAMPKSRYFSIQLIDAYTFNFDYIGTRTTGNGGGSFLIAGPGWTGKTPKGIAKAFRSETELAMAVFRTQLKDPEDLDNVKEIQAAYKVQPLSAFLGQPAPKPAPAINFVRPLSRAEERTSLEFFNVLNFVLQFSPTHSSGNKLMAQFSKIGVGPGMKFDASKLPPELKKAITDGMADAWKDMDAFQKNSIATGKVSSGDLFGSRESLRNQYFYRFAGAVNGIYGNSKQEAMYPVYRTDAGGQPLDGSKDRYTLRFAPGQLPPVNAFWSLTMYQLPSSLLVANPLNRYLINSPMLSGLKRDADGGLTLYIQRDSPGADKESNWLPAPSGPFASVLRMYWPKEDVLSGKWKQPPLRRVDGRTIGSRGGRGQT